jgi:hypothetical protein
MRQNMSHPDDEREPIAKKGDRIELLRPRVGIYVRGTVFHVDQVQILVKWDDGRSGSLRPGIDRFRIIDEP